MLPGFGSIIAFGGAGGGGGGGVTLNAVTVDNEGTGVRTASYRIDSDQFIYKGIDGVYSSVHRWTSDAVANYEGRASLIAGTSPGGSTVGSWLALTSDRTWTVTASLAGETKYCTLTIEIRDAASMAVLASAVATLIATRS